MGVRPWMVVVAGVFVWVVGQSWDLRWHAANPGMPGYGPAHLLFYAGIAIVIAGAAWWIGSTVGRRGRRQR